MYEPATMGGPPIMEGLLQRIEHEARSAGDFFTVAVGTPHYVVTKDSSPVFELHVMGPWQTTYANPDDHPHK
jgi:hypothetical protein